MEYPNQLKLSLNIPLSPTTPSLGAFNLLSDTESDRVIQNIYLSQLNELKAKLEIVSEDRQRLKKENERLRINKNTELSKFLSTQAELQKKVENERFLTLQQEISRLRKDCDEKDKLLNSMRNLLGGNCELSNILRENQVFFFDI